MSRPKINTEAKEINPVVITFLSLILELLLELDSYFRQDFYIDLLLLVEF